jgi:hypothetical protein
VGASVPLVRGVALAMGDSRGECPVSEAQVLIN